VGRCEVNLGDLNPKRSFNFGGLGMQLCFERYPEQLTDYEASLSETISPPPGQTTPYFVKAIQSDGHMAWSSPIYVKRLPQPQTTASEAPAAAGRPA
jgi:hypothetical protein